ncbi:hypothetical protein EFL59_07915 [Weissella confusa]|nr:hypothetical protein [Weissella confusa]
MWYLFFVLFFNGLLDTICGMKDNSKRRNTATRKIDVRKFIAILLLALFAPTVITNGTLQFWLVLKLGWFWFGILTGIAVLIYIRPIFYKIVFSVFFLVVMMFLYQMQGLVQGNVSTVDQENKVMTYRTATLGETNYFGTVYDKKLFGLMVLKQYDFKFVDHDRVAHKRTAKWVYEEVKRR